MITTYTYTISLPYDINNLSNNINNSNVISKKMITLSKKDKNLYVSFDNNLSIEEETELINLINNNESIINIKKQSDLIYYVKASTTENVNLNSFISGIVIDGISLNKNDLILVKNQINKIENGIYIVNILNDIKRETLLKNVNCEGAIIYVSQGQINGKSIWICTNINGYDIVGKHELNFKLYGNDGPPGPKGETGPVGPLGNIRNWTYQNPIEYIVNNTDSFEIINFMKYSYIDGLTINDKINRIEIMLYSGKITGTDISDKIINLELLMKGSTISGSCLSFSPSETYTFTPSPQIYEIKNTQNIFYKLIYTFNPITINTEIVKLFLKLSYTPSLKGNIRWRFKIYNIIIYPEHTALI